MQLGKVDAASSALTFDELTWVVKKHRNLEDSLMAGEAFLNMPRLKLVTVDADLLASALRVMREYQLDPRDSIHAASALSEGADTIISEDKHFGRLNEIRRKGISHKR